MRLNMVATAPKAMSEGNVVSIDPEAWKIVDDKLYLNYSKGGSRSVG